MRKSYGQIVGGLGFAEGLRARRGECWFSDFRTRDVQSIDLDGRITKRAYIPGQPSGLGWRPDGSLLAVSMVDQKLVSVRDGARSVVASLAGIAMGPINDMIVDDDGRAYIGSHGADLVYDDITPENAGEKLRPSPLMTVSPTGEVSVAATDLRVPNGMAWTSDGRLVVVETTGLCITAFDVDADGALSNRSVFAELPGVPDGICIDSQDGVWVALSTASKFVRVLDGEVVDEIAVDGIPVDCALGGPDRRTLFGAATYSGINVWSDGDVDSGIHAWEVDVPAPGAPEHA